MPKRSTVPTIPIGSLFSRLVVIAHAGRLSDKRRACLCRCSCGKFVLASENKLLTKNTKSCGCLNFDTMRKSKNKTHGESAHGLHTPEYRTWCGMIQRCHNPKSKDFPRWGDKGIVVCEAWRNSYVDFLSHVGRKPTCRHSLDRFPNQKGNYEPGNVRWATWGEQRKNSSGKARYVELNGERMRVSEAAEIIGLDYDYLYEKLRLLRACR